MPLTTIFQLYCLLTVCRFRTLCHKLLIKTGRLQNIRQENQYSILLCMSGEIVDEYHYILTCSALKDNKTRYNIM